MTIDYAKLANFVREELQQFLHVMQQADDESTQRDAVERLWATVNKVEALSYAPEDFQWNALSEEQRWGYLRLESYVGTALHELRQPQRMVWRVPDSHPATGVTSVKARYA